MNPIPRSRNAMLLVVSGALLTRSTARSQYTIGVFTDPGGTVSWMTATNSTPFPLYLLLRTEDAVDAVAYDLVITPAIRHRLIIVSESYGPSSNGINVRTASGSNVGLGECAIGFGSPPILVTRLDAVIISDTAAGGSSGLVAVSLVPNLGANATAVQYSDCSGILKPCSQTTSLTIDAEPLPIEAHTWSQIKSLW